MLQLAGGFHLTHRFSRPLRRGYARAVINTGAISRSAERVRHCSFAAGVVAVGQDKSAQLLAKALRVLDTEKCDEKVARVALEFAAMESAKDSADQRDAILAYKDLEFQLEGKMGYWSDILERERVKLWQSVFAALRQEIQSTSESRGWDVVVADDSSAEFLPGRDAPLEAQYKDFMRNRRILYSGASINATPIILDQMNRSWAAGPQGE